MTTPSNDNLNTDADFNAANVSYNTRGFHDAQNCGLNFIQYKDLVLNKICPAHTTISEQDRQRRIESIQKVIAHENEGKENIKREIQKNEIEKDKLEGDLAEANTYTGGAPILISGFLVLILGLALFLFYGLTLSGVIGTLVKSTSDDMNQNVGALPTLWDNFLKLPIFLKIISILLAVLPLGIGYLLHEYKQKKQWLGFIAILVFVFILDIVIAFVVEKQIYSQESLVTEMKPFNEYIDDNLLGSFGAIILLGFGAYFVWGMLLDSFLEKLSPQIHKGKVEQSVKSLQSRINGLKSEMETMIGKIINFEIDIKKLQDTTIVILDKDGKKQLEENLAEYTLGWARFIDGRFHKQPTVIESKKQELHTTKKMVIEEFYATFDSTKQ